MAILGDAAILSGLLSARPTNNAADTKGRLYLATDQGLVSRDNGTGWDDYATLLRLGTTATTAAAGNDARLADARLPIAHGASHATGGGDAIAAADIGAQPLDGDLTNIAALTPAVDDVLQFKGTAWASRTMGQLKTDLALNPMTTAGDLIVGGARGAPTRLGKGTDGQVLTVDPVTHLLGWATPAAGGGGGGSTDPTTTIGDLIYKAGLPDSADYALNHPYVDSGSSGGNSGGNIIDGNEGSYWSTVGIANGEHYTRIDLLTPRAVSKIRLRGFNVPGAQYAVNAFKLQSSADNATWIDVPGAAFTCVAQDATYTFPEITTSRIAIVVTNPTDGFGIYSFEVRRGAVTALNRLGVGAANTVLTVNPATLVPGWATPAAPAAGGGGGGGGAPTRIGQMALTAPQAMIEFANIPSTYDELRLVVTARGDAAQESYGMRLQCNGDATANYDEQRTIAYNGNTAVNDQANAATYIRAGGANGATSPAAVATVTEIVIPGYARTAFAKQILARSGNHYSANGNQVFSIFGQWRGTAAIVSLQLTLDSGNFDIGSVATLYGIG